MDKKIKKYSWIHELNAAAMKAKLLHESEQYAKQQKLLTEQRQLNEAKETGLEGLVDFIKAWGGDQPFNIPKTRRNAAAFRGWSGMVDRSPDEETAALGAGVRNIDPDNSDLDGDGEGSGLEVQADVESDGELDGNTDYENLGRIPSYNIPAQPVSTTHPTPTLPTGMDPNAVTRLGTQQAIASGVIPQSHVQRRENEAFRERRKESTVDAAVAAQKTARKKGKLPQSARQAGREAAAQEYRDFGARERQAAQEDDRFRDEQMTVDNQIRKITGR